MVICNWLRQIFFLSNVVLCMSLKCVTFLPISLPIFFFCTCLTIRNFVFTYPIVVMPNIIFISEGLIVSNYWCRGWFGTIEVFFWTHFKKHGLILNFCLILLVLLVWLCFRFFSFKLSFFHHLVSEGKGRVKNLMLRANKWMPCHQTFSRVLEWHFIFVDIYEYCEYSNEEGS